MQSVSDSRNEGLELRLLDHDLQKAVTYLSDI
jgi:hypothetical protein